MAADRQRSAPPQIHPLIPALIAVVVCGVLILVVASGSGGEDRPLASVASAPSTTTSTIPPTTTTTLPDPIDPAPLLARVHSASTPTSFRIVYDIVENELPRTETLVFRRPYESLVLSERDGEVLSGSATSKTHLRTYLSDREGWLTLSREFHRAAFDARPGAGLGALMHLGVVEEAGTGSYLGRTCTVYRTGEPPASSVVSAPTEDDFADLCIDDAGLVLHERWLIGGKLVTERTATELTLDIDIDPAIFDPGPPVDNEDEIASAFSTIAVEADEETLERLETDVPIPAGYDYDGAVFRAGNPTQGGVSSSEIVRFYSSGPDLLEVAEKYGDRPMYLGGDVAVRVRVEGWDEVWVEPGFRSSVVRARLDEYSALELRHVDIGFLLDVLDRTERVG